MGTAFKLAVEAGRATGWPDRGVRGGEAVEPDQRSDHAMTVTVNGRELEERRLPWRRCSSSWATRPYALVERNGEPIERERYDELELKEGRARHRTAGRRWMSGCT